MGHFDPEKKLIKQVLSREHCIESNKFYIKDLRIISDRKLKDLIIIDNSIVCFAYNLDNGVPINDFHADSEDDMELYYMCSYLEDIFHHYDDLREANIKSFKLSKIQQAAREKA